MSFTQHARPCLNHSALDLNSSLILSGFIVEHCKIWLIREGSSIVGESYKDVTQQTPFLNCQTSMSIHFDDGTDRVVKLRR